MATGFWFAAYDADSRVCISRGEPGLDIRTLDAAGQASSPYLGGSSMTRTGDPSAQASMSSTESW
ncbi:hypothetical protein J2X81_001658 [Sinomonas atrocyanea]|nr:hypothetical protein [Sinomonas atrocyanea]